MIDTQYTVKQFLNKKAKHLLPYGEPLV